MPEPRVWLLTGGIGVGKSSVGRLLRSMGAEVIDADQIGHDILASGGAAFEPVANRWPEVVVEGQIERGLLAGVVFGDPSKLAELEAVTHPLIRVEIERRVTSSRADLVVVEASVPKVVGSVWPIVVVDAPMAVRRERLVLRGMARADVDGRLKAQASRVEWLAMADHVIDNAGGLEDLSAAVDQFARSVGLA